MLAWPDCDGCNMLVDDGGDATLLIHEGFKWEASFAKDGKRLKKLVLDESKAARALLAAPGQRRDPVCAHRVGRRPRL